MVWPTYQRGQTMAFLGNWLYNMELQFSRIVASEKIHVIQLL